jgi:hypothetical protein
MPFLVSPGVNVREIDLTTIVPAVSTTEGALGGVFRWGPIDQRVLIDSENELVKRFGKPTNLNAETFFTAASFLGYGNRLYISRAANTAGKSPSVTVNTTSSSATVTLASGNTSELFAGLTVVSSANSGLAVGATIASIVNSTAFSLTNGADAIATKTNDEILFLSNTVFSSVANTAAVANLEAQIVKNEDHFTQKDGTFDTDVKFVARFPGELGNSLKISVCGNSEGYSSTINLSSYGTRTTIPVAVNSNTATVRQSAASNTLASSNATALQALLNVTDLIEVGNTVIGTQFMKITAIGNTTVYGNAASNVYVSTTGNTIVLVTNSTGGSAASTSNTGALYAGMVITAGNTFAVDAVVNNIINTTAFNTTVAISANLVTNSTSSTEVTLSPTATYTLSFEDRYALSADHTFVSNSTTTNAVSRYWEHYPLIDTAPGQSDYVINFGNSSINSDEMHIVIADEGGKFTGVPGTVLETYRAVSRATDAKTVDGGANYWKTVINDASQYVYAVNDISGATSATADNLANSTLDVVSYRMQLGKDGKDESNIEQSILLTSYDKFASAEDVDISLVLQGKARSFTLANYLIDNIAEKRKDCIVLISPQKGDVVNNIGNEADAVVNFRNNIRSTSYAVMDSGYKYMYDRYNDIYRWIPLNGDTAGLCVRTDQTNDPWWSPAGFNRGQIKNIVKLAYNPRQSDRDTLYKAGVNPVVTFPGQGTILFGDKTLLAKPSAFDRINVRRLFIVLEKAIATASKFTLFEFNDAFTRSQFKNLVIPYLRDVQGRRGIYDFLVVCDATNNTPEVIDRNEFVGDIYLKPARSINFIQLNFVAVRTGVSFSEVVGNF